MDVIYDCGMEADAWNTDAQLILKQNALSAAAHGAGSAGEIRSQELRQLAGVPDGQGLDEITEYLEKGSIVPVIDTVYEFEKLQPALTKLKGRHARGKLVIQVNPESQG